MLILVWANSSCLWVNTYILLIFTLYISAWHSRLKKKSKNKSTNKFKFKVDTWVVPEFILFDQCNANRTSKVDVIGSSLRSSINPRSIHFLFTSSRFSRRKTTLHWFYKWMQKNFENGGNLSVRKRRLIWFKTASDTLDTSSFEASSQDRVGGAMAEKIRKFKRKMESITNGKKKEKVASRDLGEHKTGWG